MMGTSRPKIGGALAEMFKNLFRRRTTEKYPFGPPSVTPRFRGELDIDPAKCTGCSICAIVCPASVVSMVTIGTRTIGERRVEVQRPVFDLLGCISCGQCVDDCKFGALSLTHAFELATPDKNSLMMRKAIPNAG